MIHHPIAVAVCCLAASALSFQAQATSAKPAAKAPAKASTKPAAKAVARSPGKPSATTARALAPQLPSPSGLNEAQMAMAGQVLTGQVDCEFKQTVMVEPHASKAGHFRVKYNSAVYQMVPEETSTGAVRLIDAKAGVVWLQIPVKSMMMNSKVGRRMVDACSHPTQRLAEAEARAAQAALAASAMASPAITQSVDKQIPATAATGAAPAASASVNADAGNPPLLR